MNQVHLIGVVATPVKLDEFPSTSKGPQTKATFLCAVRRRDRRQEPDWVRVETWGVQARNLVRFNGKGSRVAITGRLRGTFYNPEGGDRGGQLRLVVVAESITYLSAPKVESAQDDSAPPGARQSRR
ncbi:MAG: single-stranded DNA-binding protein [Candidatus Dormibacteria bacterium]